MASISFLDAESDCLNIKIEVVLPTGKKEVAYINPENKVYEEKEAILRRADIPYPNLYVLVLFAGPNKRIILEDKLLMERYMDDLAGGQESYIEIRKKSSEIERPPKPVNCELFNIQLK
ncbi:unnamed protein product [Lymnaea stagnalis]|uniref:Ubiquitin-like domain-containing protein n=1 Tax=Lymnaea stagnalis TaxID=6523 RepID=A0AAV2HDB2_LYMST